MALAVTVPWKCSARHAILRTGTHVPERIVYITLRAIGGEFTVAFVMPEIADEAPSPNVILMVL